MIHLRSLKKLYGDLTAVDNLSLEIQAGEAFGLLGPNGAGKSTTIGMCTGLLSPTSGEVTFGDGLSPASAEARGRIGVAPQALALYEDLTCSENLTFFGRLHGLKGSRLRDRVNDMLEFSGLEERAGSRVSTFSGGMKRRLNLAAALVHEPEIVFLDEPTAGVDPQSRNVILDRIGELRDRGLTIVFSTHYMEEAERLCDRASILDRGRLIAMGTVGGLIAEHGGSTSIRAEVNGVVEEEVTDDPVSVLGQLQAKGELTDFHMRRPGLESVFLNLTGRKLRD